MNDSNHNQLMTFYHTLLNHFGPQHWWPGDSPFEVMVGAVLTQNTNWTNVEKAITNLKAADMLDPHKIDSLSHEELAPLIKPAGYFNIKAKRLKNLVKWFCAEHQGSIESLARLSLDQLTEQLLSINGVGRETADSIILYALNKPTFVVDTYTYRILTRHACIDTQTDYQEIKDYCQYNLPQDVTIYNECHALFVQLGKNYCKPRPNCTDCPLNKFDHSLEP